MGPEGKGNFKSANTLFSSERGGYTVLPATQEEIRRPGYHHNEQAQADIVRDILLDIATIEQRQALGNVLFGMLPFSKNPR